MSGVTPVVRCLIPCEDIRVEPTDARKVSLVNLIHAIRSQASPPYPVTQPELCVFVQLTGCRGSGEVAIQIVHADSGRVISSSPTRTAQLSTDPLAVVGLSFRMRACSFPEAGLYYIRFCYNDTPLAEQPLLLE